MAIHISNFGRFKSYVCNYADIDGYIPEQGDDWRDMNYDLSGEDLSGPKVLEYCDEEWWPEFVDRATTAVQEALNANDDWWMNDA